MNGEPWPEEMFERAAAMWREGISASKIAAAIGKGRGAIAGKMQRSGVMTPSSQGARLGVPRPRTPQAKRGEKWYSAPKREAPKQPSRCAAKLPPFHRDAPHLRPLPMPIVIPGEPKSLGLPLVELGAAMCHWPTGASAGHHTFCGAKTHSLRIYCSFHEIAKTARGMATIRARAGSASAKERAPC